MAHVAAAGDEQLGVGFSGVVGGSDRWEVGGGSAAGSGSQLERGTDEMTKSIQPPAFYGAHNRITRSIFVLGLGFLVLPKAKRRSPQSASQFMRRE